jgi:hypothetical protein
VKPGACENCPGLGVFYTELAFGPPRRHRPPPRAKSRKNVAQGSITLTHDPAIPCVSDARPVPLFSRRGVNGTPLQLPRTRSEKPYARPMRISTTPLERKSHAKTHIPRSEDWSLRPRMGKIVYYLSSLMPSSSPGPFSGTGGHQACAFGATDE